MVIRDVGKRHPLQNINKFIKNFCKNIKDVGECRKLTCYNNSRTVVRAVLF